MIGLPNTGLVRGWSAVWPHGLQYLGMDGSPPPEVGAPPVVLRSYRGEELPALFEAVTTPSGTMWPLCSSGERVCIHVSGLVASRSDIGYEMGGSVEESLRPLPVHSPLRLSRCRESRKSTSTAMRRM
jgi:hypothetical protein